MYSDTQRAMALEAVSTCESLSEASRLTGVSRAALRDWLAAPRPDRSSGCPRCDDVALAAEPYAALLGFYLGDGCISAAPRCFTLRVSCDAAYPSIIEDVERCLRSVRPGGRVFRVTAPGCVVVQSNWKHWPCLFPQHGPGRKHERPIALDDWQRSAVEVYPAAFLRGLFHSDGSRARNWTRRMVGGEMKRYDYPRWQFTNNSADIRELCCWALDLAGISWRQASWKNISVARRDDVARLDELIGLKA
jgi:hypothetical protein